MPSVPDDGEVSARTVILDLLATGHGAAFSAADFVRAGTAFGLGPISMRTAITRLKAETRLVQEGRGSYRVGPAAEPLQRRIRGWRSVLERRTCWDGAWLLALAGPAERADRTIWRHTVKALGFEGFVEAETNVWARPANLAGGAEAMRQRLAELGYASSLLLVTAWDFDAVRRERLPGLWDGPALAGGHTELRIALQRSRDRLARAEPATAAAETLRLGRRAVRRIVLDPLLPDSFGTAEALRALVAAMEVYDGFGKAVWRDFLAA